MDQVLQVIGALLILAAYLAAQRGRLGTASWPYLWLNLVGAALLAVLALLDRDWGFLLLEGAWSLITAWSIVERLRLG